jgi:hypothetical protein
MIRYMILPPSLRWPKFLLYNFPEIGRSIEPDIKIMKYSCVSLRLLATAICTAKKKKKKKKKFLLVKLNWVIMLSIRLAFTTEPLAVSWEHHFHLLMYEERGMGKVLITFENFDTQLNKILSTGGALMKHGRKSSDLKLWFVVESCELFLMLIFFLQENGHIQRMAPFQAPPMGWPGAQGIPTTPIVKRVLRLDVPVDKYPSVSKYVPVELILTFFFQFVVVPKIKLGSIILSGEFWDHVETHWKELKPWQNVGCT